MKIAIITFHKAENFGSVLQVYALSSVLKHIGHSVKTIDFEVPVDMIQYNLFRTHIYKQRPQAFLGDLVYIKKNFLRKRRFSNFRKQYLDLTEKTYIFGKNNLQGLNDEYDAFICGSDQIWNTECTKGVIPEFFLSFVEDTRKKIAYAPSMPKKPNKKYFKQLKKLISRINFLSVREFQTIRFLQEDIKIKSNIEHVLDPTLLLNDTFYVDELGLSKQRTDNRQYIFVYILEDSDFNHSLIVKEAVKVSKKTGMTIKYVFMRKIKAFSNGKYVFGIGPREFLEYIFNAAYVMTNSFHASVFSIIFNVAFCVFPRKDSESRMIELLETLNLMSNIYTTDNNQWMDSRPYDITKEKLNVLKRSSIKYLMNSLEG